MTIFFRELCSKIYWLINWEIFHNCLAAVPTIADADPEDNSDDESNNLRATTLGPQREVKAICEEVITQEQLALLDSQVNPFNFAERVSQTFRNKMRVCNLVLAKFILWVLFRFPTNGWSFFLYLLIKFSLALLHFLSLFQFGWGLSFCALIYLLNIVAVFVFFLNRVQVDQFQIRPPRICTI